jgi:hypothetical protein
MIPAAEWYHFVRFSMYVPPGELFRVGLDLWARHPADLTPGILGTKWHVGQSRCPTWTGDDCRCMTEGVA